MRGEWKILFVTPAQKFGFKAQRRGVTIEILGRVVGAGVAPS